MNMVANFKPDLSEHNWYLIHCFGSKFGGGPAKRVVGNCEIAHARHLVMFMYPTKILMLLRFCLEQQWLL